MFQGGVRRKKDQTVNPDTFVGCEGGMNSNGKEVQMNRRERLSASKTHSESSLPNILVQCFTDESHHVIVDAITMPVIDAFKIVAGREGNHEASAHSNRSTL